MQTSPQRLIEEYTARGWWGDDTLTTLFARALAGNPDRTALVDPPNRPALAAGDAARLSYRELDERVERTCAALYANGVRSGHIVVVQLPNIAELAIAFLALARIGAIASPVPVQYGRHELAHIKNALDADAYVSVGEFKGQDFLAERAPAFDGCRLFCVASAENAAAIDLDRYEVNSAEREAFEAYFNELEPDANDIFTVCWTSGTTGTPKGVPRSFNHWIAIAVGSGDLAKLEDGDALLNPFPMVNMGGIGGFLFNWLKCAGTLVLHHPMDLPVFLGQIADEKINYTIAPPALLNTLLQKEELLSGIDLGHLRAIGSGSAPLAPWMVEGYEKKYGIAILNNFGSNEGMCFVSGPEEVPDPALRGELFPRIGSGDFEWSARIAAMVETRLVDTTTGETIDEPDVPGELLIRGPTVFDGYWNSPDVNKEVFSEDGFFHTGDLFEIAAPDGEPRYFRFVGRHKDIIARGGMKISPAELDNLLTGHPLLADAAVVGVPDPVLEQRIGVAVVPKPGKVVELDDVTEFLKAEGVAVFKLPESLRVVEELPRNPLGKVLRHELAPLFAAEERPGHA